MNRFKIVLGLLVLVTLASLPFSTKAQESQVNVCATHLVSSESNSKATVSNESGVQVFDLEYLTSEYFYSPKSGSTIDVSIGSSDLSVLIDGSSDFNSLIIADSLTGGSSIARATKFVDAKDDEHIGVVVTNLMRAGGTAILTSDSGDIEGSVVFGNSLAFDSVEIGDFMLNVVSGDISVSYKLNLSQLDGGSAMEIILSGDSSNSRAYTQFLNCGLLELNRAENRPEPKKPSYVRFIHLGANLPTVDIYNNDTKTLLVDGLSFSDGTGYMSVSASTKNFKFLLATGGEIRMNNISLEEGKSYNIMVVPNVNAPQNAVAILLNENRDNISSSRARLVFSHTNPNLGIVNIIETNPSTVIASNINFGDVLFARSDVRVNNEDVGLDINGDQVEDITFSLNRTMPTGEIIVMHITRDSAGNTIIVNQYENGVEDVLYGKTDSTQPEPTEEEPNSVGGEQDNAMTQPVVINENLEEILSQAREMVQTLENSNSQQVLGASSCRVYMNEFIIIGDNHNPLEVKKLQIFLSEYLDTELSITGVYDEPTIMAAKLFQSLESEYVLDPWGIDEPTGHVYLTTETRINNIMCPDLNLPIPNLIPVNEMY